MLKSLPSRICLAVVAGLVLGYLFPNGELKPLADIGKLIIHWIKLIAGPFLFLTILASIIEVQVQWRQGLRLVFTALFNTSIAIVIGITLTSLFLTDVHLESFQMSNAAKNIPTAPAELSFAAWMKTLMPKSLFEPFLANDILLIALLGLILGIAIRKIFENDEVLRLKIISGVEQVRKVPALLLQWIIQVIPLAVFVVIAGAVSEFGFAVFGNLFVYLAVVIAGFILQIILVYCPWVFLIAKMPVKKVLSAIREPVFYSFGVNSSLATLPLTLAALKKLNVSQRSAALGAGVATNLNNDGIVLYEAIAVFFIASLYHIPMDPMQMALAAAACIVASMGITGIPEAGFISLSVVITTLGFPVEMLPLLLAVDWIIARLRSVMNVLSDITLSIAID